jgi:hypothetical protein
MQPRRWDQLPQHLSRNGGIAGFRKKITAG